MIQFDVNLQAIGYGISLICFVAENAVGFLCKKFNKCRSYIHHAFIIVCLFAAVNVWRGLWLFMELKTGEKINQNQSHFN